MAQVARPAVRSEGRGRVEPDGGDAADTGPAVRAWLVGLCAPFGAMRIAGPGSALMCGDASRTRTLIYQAGTPGSTRHPFRNSVIRLVSCRSSTSVEVGRP